MSEVLQQQEIDEIRVIDELTQDIALICLLEGVEI